MKKSELDLSNLKNNLATLKDCYQDYSAEKEEKIIREILSQYPYDFYYYGSRVKGDYSKSSDLDILLKYDKEISISEIEEIELLFNKSKIPYIVNISQFANMDEKFYAKIKDSLVLV